MNRKLEKLKLVVVFVVGLSLGAAAAYALDTGARNEPTPVAKVIGNAGYLFGWTVIYESETVCTDPYVWTATKEIECE